MKGKNILALGATLATLGTTGCEIPGRRTNEQTLAESSQPKALTLYQDRLSTFWAYCAALRAYEENGESTRLPAPPEIELSSSRDIDIAGWQAQLQLGERVDREDLLGQTVEDLRSELGMLGFTVRGTLRCYPGRKNDAIENDLLIRRSR